MLYLHALCRAVEIDAVEPFVNALVQLDPSAAVDETFAGDGLADAAAFADHGIQIGENAVHLLRGAEDIGFFPKLGGLHIQAGDKTVVLHILGAKGFIKVVHDRDNGSVHKLPPDL